MPPISHWRDDQRERSSVTTDLLPSRLTDWPPAESRVALQAIVNRYLRYDESMAEGVLAGVPYFLGQAGAQGEAARFVGLAVDALKKLAYKPPSDRDLGAPSLHIRYGTLLNTFSPYLSEPEAQGVFAELLEMSLDPKSFVRQSTTTAIKILAEKAPVDARAGIANLLTQIIDRDTLASDTAKPVAHALIQGLADGGLAYSFVTRLLREAQATDAQDKFGAEALGSLYRYAGDIASFPVMSGDLSEIVTPLISDMKRRAPEKEGGTLNVVESSADRCVFRGQTWLLWQLATKDEFHPHAAQVFDSVWSLYDGQNGNLEAFWLQQSLANMIRHAPHEAQRRFEEAVHAFEFPYQREFPKDLDRPRDLIPYDQAAFFASAAPIERVPEYFRTFLGYLVSEISWHATCQRSVLAGSWQDTPLSQPEVDNLMVHRNQSTTIQEKLSEAIHFFSVKMESPNVEDFADLLFALSTGENHILCAVLDDLIKTRPHLAQHAFERLLAVFNSAEASDTGSHDKGHWDEDQQRRPNREAVLGIMHSVLPHIPAEAAARYIEPLEDYQQKAAWFNRHNIRHGVVEPSNLLAEIYTLPVIQALMGLRGVKIPHGHGKECPIAVDRDGTRILLAIFDPDISNQGSWVRLNYNVVYDTRALRLDRLDLRWDFSRECDPLLAENFHAVVSQALQKGLELADIRDATVTQDVPQWIKLTHQIESARLHAQYSGGTVDMEELIMSLDLQKARNFGGEVLSLSVAALLAGESAQARQLTYSDQKITGNEVTNSLTEEAYWIGKELGRKPRVLFVTWNIDRVGSAAQKFREMDFELATVAPGEATIEFLQDFARNGLFNPVDLICVDSSAFGTIRSGSGNPPPQNAVEWIRYEGFYQPILTDSACFKDERPSTNGVLLFSAVGCSGLLEPTFEDLVNLSLIASPRRQIHLLLWKIFADTAGNGLDYAKTMTNSERNLIGRLTELVDRWGHFLPKEDFMFFCNFIDSIKTSTYDHYDLLNPLRMALGKWRSSTSGQNTHEVQNQPEWDRISILSKKPKLNLRSEAGS